MTERFDDEVNATMNLYVAAGEYLSPALVDAAVAVNVRADGSRALTIGRVHVEEPDDISRQAEFERQLREFLYSASARGFGDAARAGHRLLISFALVPETGHAGVLLTKDLVAGIAALGAEFEMQSWPGATWQASTM